MTTIVENRRVGEERGRAQGVARILCDCPSRNQGSGETGRNRASPTTLLHVSYYDMWPFKNKKAAEDTTINERLVRMEKRIDRLEEDWTEVYGKFRTLQMRVAKQVQRLDEDSSSEEPQPAGGDAMNGNSAFLSSLSPRQREINQQILTRRRGVAKGGE